MLGRRTVLLGALLLVPAGCGSSATSKPASGRQVFAQECSFCHSLSGHSSPRQQGGDLLNNRLARPVLTQFTAEMPVKHKLTAPQLRAVVDYVLQVQQRGP